MSNTISRVLYLTIIYLDLTLLLVKAQATYPEHDGQPYYSCSVLLRMGVTSAASVTRNAVSSYLAFSPLPDILAVLFCCTGLGVTSTGRYPASCPMKPGLSSPAVFRHLQPRSSVLLIWNYFTMRKKKIVNSFPADKKGSPAFFKKFFLLPQEESPAVFEKFSLFLSIPAKFCCFFRENTFGI